MSIVIVSRRALSTMGTYRMRSQNWNEKRNAITETEVKSVLADGVARAKAVSNQTIENVRKAIGIAL